MAGLELTAWIAGVSFVSANLGSLELIELGRRAYQYGILATHWYWIGPARRCLSRHVIMPLLLPLKNPPFPGYLSSALWRRHKQLELSSITFAFMTVLNERHQYLFDGAGHESPFCWN